MQRHRRRRVCRIVDLAVYLKRQVMLGRERTADERSFASIHRAGRLVSLNDRRLRTAAPFWSLSVGSLAFVAAVCFPPTKRGDATGGLSVGSARRGVYYPSTYRWKS